MQTIIHICLRKNKSKQSYVWIDSIFEAQSICFETEIAGFLDFSYNKYALDLHFFRSLVDLLFSVTISAFARPVLFELMALSLYPKALGFFFVASVSLGPPTSI